MRTQTKKLTTKSRFAGHYLLQNATLIRAAETIESAHSSVSTIKIDDFINMLSFIEASVASSKLYYDATTGGSVEEELRAAEQVLETNLSHPLGKSLLDPAQLVSSDDKLTLSVSAMARVSFKLDQISQLKSPPENGGFNLTNYGMDVERFSKDISNAPANESDLRERSIQILEANAYRGSKCVAAILGLAADNFSQENTELLNNLRSRFGENVSLKDRSQFQSALINDVFRPVFLPTLADQVCEGVFLGNERAVKATSEYNRSYVNFLVHKHVSEMNVAPLAWDLMQNYCAREEQFPWLGLTTFLSANAKNPFDLLDYALSLRSQVNTDVNAARTLSPWHLSIDNSEAQKRFIENQYEQLFSFGESFQTSRSHPIMFSLSLPPDVLAGIVSLVCRLTGIDADTIPIAGEALEAVLALASEAPDETGSAVDYFSAQRVDEIITRSRVRSRHQQEQNLITVHSNMKILVSKALLDNETLGQKVRATCMKTFGAEITM